MPNDASFLYKKSFTGNYFEFAALAVNVVNPNTGWVVTACNNSPQHALSDKLQVFFFSAVYLTGLIVVFLNMPRNYKRKTNKANMPFSTYQEAAKRVIDHGESLRKVAADFDILVSTVKLKLAYALKLAYLNYYLSRSIGL